MGFIYAEEQWTVVCPDQVENLCCQDKKDKSYRHFNNCNDQRGLSERLLSYSRDIFQRKRARMLAPRGRGNLPSSRTNQKKLAPIFLP